MGQEKGVPQNGNRIAIIGAGPIGLEAAMFASQRGFDVTVIERGQVAENVRSWGHVRLFSPFAMNSSPWGRAALAGPEHDSGTNRNSLPSDDSLLTGAEFAAQYLLPLSRHPLIADRIRKNTDVVAIGRGSLWKTDLIGTARQESPFQLLVRTELGEEMVESDFVLDCSGTYSNHNRLGAGGSLCPGEILNEKRITWTLPDVPGRDRDEYAGQRTLVIGSGYSAATTVAHLAQLATEAPTTSIVWLTRTDRQPPVTAIPDDSLTERAALTARANQLAMERGGVVDWKSNSLIRSVASRPQGSFVISVESHGRIEKIEADRIVAHVGYRPDRSLYEELQIHECYATEGPIKLAATLLGEASADCLTQSCPGADTLTNPEPGFFILGTKSYGRSSQFLLRIGIEQIETIFTLIPKP
jgi:thioredoxin reductase